MQDEYQNIFAHYDIYWNYIPVNFTVVSGAMAQVEPHLAINPTNPSNLICAVIENDGYFNTIGCYYTLDSGANWIKINNFSGSGMGDPVVAFDPDGVAYVLYQNISMRSFFFRRSYDFGESWSSEEAVFHIDSAKENLDKPWLAISPIRNNNGYFDIYLSYTQTYDDNGPDFSKYTVRVIKSVDSGISFNPVPVKSIVATDTFFPQGSSIAVGPGGDIALSWAFLEYSDVVPNKESVGHPLKEIGVWHSNDPSTIHKFPTAQIGVAVKEQNKFIYALKEQTMKVDSYPRMTVNNLTGTFYISWAGQNSSADIFLIRGEGQNWTTLAPVDSSPGDQFFPTISVSPNGVLSVLYYSTANDNFVSLLNLPDNSRRNL